VGEVQVERSDRGKTLPVVIRGTPTRIFSQFSLVVVLGIVRMPALPVIGYLARKAQTVAARVMRLDVGPKPHPQVVGQRL